MTLQYCISGVTNPIESHGCCSMILPLLNISYTNGQALHAFQGGQRYRGHFGAYDEENEGGGAGGGGSHWRSSSGDVALGHALRWQFRSRLVIARAAKEDDGGDHCRVRGVWPHRIGGQD